jgi:hypothetical protein
MALDLYNHNVSDLGWFSAIIQRELHKFEMAERKRLRDGVEVNCAGAMDVTTIMASKFELILIGIITQALSEIEHYDKVNEETNAVQMDRLKINIAMLKITLGGRQGGLQERLCRRSGRACGVGSAANPVGKTGGRAKSGLQGRCGRKTGNRKAGHRAQTVGATGRKSAQNQGQG